MELRRSEAGEGFHPGGWGGFIGPLSCSAVGTIDRRSGSRKALALAAFAGVKFERGRRSLRFRPKVVQFTAAPSGPVACYTLFGSMSARYYCPR